MLDAVGLQSKAHTTISNTLRLYQFSDEKWNLLSVCHCATIGWFVRGRWLAYDNGLSEDALTNSSEGTFRLHTYSSRAISDELIKNDVILVLTGSLVVCQRWMGRRRPGF